MVRDNQWRCHRPQKIIMKREHYRSKRSRILPLALCAALCGAGAFGQGPRGQGGPGGPGGPGQQGGRPPLPPVIRALDTNRDGIIEADEIANAAQSLRTLETSGSDVLTMKELLGRPPRGMRQGGQGGQGQRQGEGPGISGTQSGLQGGPPPMDGPPPMVGQGGQGSDQNGPPPGPPPPEDNGPGASQSGSNGQTQMGPPPGGAGGHRHHRLPPVIQALDTNHDGIIEASEIDNAPQSLKTLEQNGQDYLTIPELLGPPPGRPPRQQGQSGSQGQGQGQGQQGQGQGDDPGGPPGPPPPPPDDSSSGQGAANGQTDGGPPPPPPPQQ
jgi:hypothetical protein